MVFASWLVHSTPERAVWVRALAGDVVLCSWARHFTLTQPLFTQVYKWVPVNCWGNLTKLQGSDLQWTNILSRRRSSKYYQPLHATETGISSGSYELALAPRLQFLGSGLHTPTQLFCEYPTGDHDRASDRMQWYRST